MKSKDTEIVSKILQRTNDLKVKRQPYEPIWQDISDYILPNRQDFITEQTVVTRRDIELYDTTAVQANEMLAAAIYSGLTSVAARWFGLTTTNGAFAKNDTVKRWLEEVTDAMFDVFNSSETNFAQQNHELLLDLVAYGTACMYVDDYEGNIRFSARHLTEILISENSKGIVDTVARIFKFTARQAVQEWGEDKIGKKITDALSKKPDDKFKFIQIAMPYKDAQRLYEGQQVPVSDKFSYVCFYIGEDDKNIIDVQGFYDNPFIVVRWEKLVGEYYGRAPGWNVLADVKMVNKMSETLIRAAEKQVDPPLIMADDGVVMPLETHPSGVNIGGVSADGRPLVQPLITNGNINLGDAMVEQRRDSIRRGYFVDQFQQKQGTPVSATEYAQHAEDKLRLTGPQLFRLQSEYLEKVILRVFGIKQRNNQFPPVPNEVKGLKLKIEYTSPLVRSQRFDELQAFNKVIQSLGILIQADPTLLDNFDGDSLVRNYSDISGVSIRNMRKTTTTTPVTVEQVREARQKQQQQQQQQQVFSQGADAVAKLKKAGADLGGIV